MANGCITDLTWFIQVLRCLTKPKKQSHTMAQVPSWSNKPNMKHTYTNLDKLWSYFKEIANMPQKLHHSRIKHFNHVKTTYQNHKQWIRTNVNQHLGQSIIRVSYIHAQNNTSKITQTGPKNHTKNLKHTSSC